MAVTYQHGVVSTVSGLSLGLIQSCKVSRSASVATAADETGDVSAMTTYNVKEDAQVEYVHDTSVSLPTIGSTYSIGSDKYKLISVEVTESNTEYKRVSLSLERYVTNTIPAS